MLCTVSWRIRSGLKPAKASGAPPKPDGSGFPRLQGTRAMNTSTPGAAQGTHGVGCGCVQRSDGRLLPAVFLDRDGTLVHPRHYPSRPGDLRLYDGLDPYLRCLQESGFRLVVVTNQSGIARGYFTETDLRQMHAHLAAQLARMGVRLDAIYHCPHHPDGAIPELAVRCTCRKPQPGMVLRAAADLGLDPRRSWLVGDILDDVEAGNRAGCRTILVDLGTEPPPERAVRRPDFVARDTLHALQIITTIAVWGSWPADLSHATSGSPAQTPDLTYHPPHWPPIATADGVDPAEPPGRSAYAQAGDCLGVCTTPVLPTGGSHGSGS
jgi:D-glycero-D-manno-heptose 1,7-bisphosphate phosphatase